MLRRTVLFRGISRSMQISTNTGCGALSRGWEEGESGAEVVMLVLDAWALYEVKCDRRGDKQKQL